jgi:hypothetical protein
MLPTTFADAPPSPCGHAGVPPQLRFVPGVIDAVKASVKGDVEQLMDKMHFVADKVGA